jgi:hypothetical protein
MKLLISVLIILFQFNFAKAETRSYAMSVAGIQTKPGSDVFYGLNVSGADLAVDADMVTAVVEAYGVPWNVFAESETPPPGHLWTKTMTNMAANLRSGGKPIILQLFLTRERITGLAMADDSLKPNDNWASKCFDFGGDNAKYSLAYARYAAWMTRMFKPRQVVVAVEVNEYLHTCGKGGGWNSVVEVSNNAYDAVKSVDPKIIAYPSFTAGPLYSDHINGFDSATYKSLSGLKRDRFGLSIYPKILKRADEKPPLPSDLPADLLTRVRDQNREEKLIAITETGWNSNSISYGTPDQCVKNAVVSTEDEATSYLRWLLQNAQSNTVKLVTWWSKRDLLPKAVMGACYPTIGLFSLGACKGDIQCTAVNIFRKAFGGDGVLGELVYKIFGTMGLYDYNGKPKPALLAQWKKALVQTYRE